MSSPNVKTVGGVIVLGVLVFLAIVLIAQKYSQPVALTPAIPTQPAPKPQFTQDQTIIQALVLSLSDKELRVQTREGKSQTITLNDQTQFVARTYATDNTYTDAPAQKSDIKKGSPLFVLVGAANGDQVTAQTVYLLIHA